MPGEDDPSRTRGGVSRGSYSAPPTITEPVSPEARATMLANKRRDTGPELAIRSILHRAGLRYTVDAPLPFDRRRRADVVFTRAGLYVFVDGCFWHGCPDHFVPPKTRTEFWTEKISRNRARDMDTDRRLLEASLTPLRLWEHTPADLAAEIVMARYRQLLPR